MQWREFRSHVQYLSEEDLSRIQKAYELGKKMHADQKRKSGEPYFIHPIQVATILTELKLDLATIITALLHDTIEDTDATYEIIEKEFGKNVTTRNWNTVEKLVK